MKKNDTLEKLVSEAELGALWGVHRSTVGRLLAEAGVSPVYLSQKRAGSKRYRQVDINQYLESVGGK